MIRILFLEDEYALRESVEEVLKEEGYLVDSVENGETALEILMQKPFDLLLLDIKVPGINGMELLKEVRQCEIQTPAIFLTSVTDVDVLEEGYRYGCSDYIRKPFDIRELKLRIKQAIQAAHFQGNREQVELAGGYRYDLGDFALHHENEMVKITKTESQIIDLLVRNRGKVVTIEQFQNEIWGEYVDPANVRVQINNLRKKLGQELILNVRGFGYKID